VPEDIAHMAQELERRRIVDGWIRASDTDISGVRESLMAGYGHRTRTSVVHDEVLEFRI
jgi:hypothetical protein